MDIINEIVTPNPAIQLWPRQAQESGNCIECPAEIPRCSCKKNQVCVQVPRLCNVCATVRCDTVSGGSGGLNPGVIAGPVVGAVIVAASLCLFWWLRRKKRRDLARLEDLADRARKGESSAFHLSNSGSPSTSRHQSAQFGARSSTSNGSQSSSQRLPNAPVEHEYRDANGNTVRVYGKRGAINADPNHPDNGGSGDPFGDHASLSTDRAESGHSTNVVPIHFVPGQDSPTARAGQPSNAAQQAAAARTLDQARQNLWRPRAPPPRPARAPDLDLRLNPMQQADHNQLLADGSSSRDSFRSGISVTPSFLSGATGDLHIDVPKIMTRQAVQVGRLQAAEMVQFGVQQPVSFGTQQTVSEETTSSTGSDPFTERHAEMLNLTPPNSATPHAGGVPAQSSTSLASRAFDDEGNVSQPSPTDLRFSMGSLAYDRASVSTQGTSNHNHGRFLSPQDQPPVPSLPAGYERQRLQSMSSYKSTGNDSLLGSFPMIPPASGGTNASNTDLSSPQTGSAPPTAFKATPGAGAGTAPGGRPLTTASAHSLADSFLGRFPFVPPNVDADGSSRASEQAHPSRLTLGMSNVSGLGGFEFSFDRSGSSGDEAPPLPTGQRNAETATASAASAAPPSPAQRASKD
ncbi:hypothetical protein CspHIS471_0101200 [Cutaneotrichosporon sp. HIS471]|nr:hypothetical protein CspHIS471_0101200 [Cutaneotrichosporon sp. HIS471]